MFNSCRDLVEDLLLPFSLFFYNITICLQSIVLWDFFFSNATITSDSKTVAALWEIQLLLTLS